MHLCTVEQSQDQFEAGDMPDWLPVSIECPCNASLLTFFVVAEHSAEGALDESPGEDGEPIRQGGTRV